MAVDPAIEDFAFALFRKLWVQKYNEDYSIFVSDYPLVDESACPDNFCDTVYAFKCLTTPYYEEMCETEYITFAYSKSDFYFYLYRKMSYFLLWTTDFQLLALGLALLTAEMGEACARRKNSLFVLSCPLAFAMVFEESFQRNFVEYGAGGVWKELFASGVRFRLLHSFADRIGRSINLRRDLNLRVALLTGLGAEFPEDFNYKLSLAILTGFVIDADMSSTMVIMKLKGALLFPMYFESILQEPYVDVLVKHLTTNQLWDNISDLIVQRVLENVAEKFYLDGNNKEAFIALYKDSLMEIRNEIPPHREYPTTTFDASSVHKLLESERDELPDGGRSFGTRFENWAETSPGISSVHQLRDSCPRDDRVLKAGNTRPEEYSDAPSVHELYDLHTEDNRVSNVGDTTKTEAYSDLHINDPRSCKTFVALPKETELISYIDFTKSDPSEEENEVNETRLKTRDLEHEPLPRLYELPEQSNSSNSSVRDVDESFDNFEAYQPVIDHSEKRDGKARVLKYVKPPPYELSAPNRDTVIKNVGSCTGHCEGHPIEGKAREVDECQHANGSGHSDHRSEGHHLSTSSSETNEKHPRSGIENDRELSEPTTPSSSPTMDKAMREDQINFIQFVETFQHLNFGHDFELWYSAYSMMDSEMSLDDLDVSCTTDGAVSTPDLKSGDAQNNKYSIGNEEENKVILINDGTNSPENAISSQLKPENCFSKNNFERPHIPLISSASELRNMKRNLELSVSEVENQNMARYDEVSEDPDHMISVVEVASKFGDEMVLEDISVSEVSYQGQSLDTRVSKPGILEGNVSELKDQEISSGTNASKLVNREMFLNMSDLKIKDQEKSLVISSVFELGDQEPGTTDVDDQMVFSPDSVSYYDAREIIFDFDDIESNPSENVMPMAKKKSEKTSLDENQNLDVFSETRLKSVKADDIGNLKVTLHSINTDNDQDVFVDDSSSAYKNRSIFPTTDHSMSLEYLKDVHPDFEVLERDASGHTISTKTEEGTLLSDWHTSPFYIFSENRLKSERLVEVGKEIITEDFGAFKLIGREPIDENCSKMESVYFKQPVTNESFQLPDDRFSVASSTTSEDSICTVISVETYRFRTIKNDERELPKEKDILRELPTDEMDLSPTEERYISPTEEKDILWELPKNERDIPTEERNIPFESPVEKWDLGPIGNKTSTNLELHQPKSPRKDAQLKLETSKSVTDESLENSFSKETLTKGDQDKFMKDSKDASEKAADGSKSGKKRSKKKNKQNTVDESKGPSIASPEESESTRPDLGPMILVLGTPFEYLPQQRSSFMDRINKYF